MKVRTAQAADAETMRAIYNDAVATTTATMDTDMRSPEEQARWMAEHDGNPYPALVAEEEDGRIVGWAALSPYNRKPGYATTAEISVYVHRDWRGHGAGRALLSELVEEAKQRDFHSLIALITTGNAASQRLHEHQGFTVVGTLRQVARKFHTWVDVTILQMNFPEPEAPAEDEDESLGSPTS